MNTLITGCSGLIGSALIEQLFKAGHSIQCCKRNSSVDSKQIWSTQSLSQNLENGFDHVIHLAGENVANGRWSSSKKQAILSSRINGTKELIDHLSIQENKPKTFLCASAVGFYGSRGDKILDENSSQGDGFLAEVCELWEQETYRLKKYNTRVINLRFGMVLSPHGGALHKMIPPFKAGVGGTIGSGEQFISWISINDLVKSIEFLINKSHISGPVNIVSPIQTTNKELTQLLGKVLNKPTFFKVPAFIAKAIFGQMADEMLLTSNRTTPKVLLESGFKFEDQSLETVLKDCVGT